MRAVWGVAGLLLVAMGSCYRGEGSPPPSSPSESRGQQAERAACSGADDLALPPIDVNPMGRLRTHSTGPLVASAKRSWAGPAVPEHVPQQVGTLELFLADDADRGILALYREPYDLGSCTLGSAANCAYEARYYTDHGQLAWSLRLNELLSRPDHLEIQDIRLVDGVLYFNEACQSYARNAGGACSSLVAVEGRTGQVLWRTPPLVSNGRFVVRGCYLVAGYGFTAEPDQLALVERATGAVVQTIPVSSAPSQMQLVERDRLDVTLASGTMRRYRLDGVDTGDGRLVSLDPPEPMFGGAGYGGSGYGGSSYGGSSYGGASYGGQSYGRGAGTLRLPVP